MNSLMHRSEYATMYHSEEKLWWYIALRHMLKYQLSKYAPQQAYILDAGCGTGKNLEFVTSLGHSVEGFDYSADAIEYCKLRGLQQVKQGNIVNIQYPDDTFDVVYCMDVLGSLAHHDRQKAADEMLRVLKPGGLLICHTASLELFRSQHDDVANIKLRLNKQQMRALFNNAPSEIRKLSYRIFLLSPLVLIFKLVKRITGLFKKSDESATDQVIFPFGINWLLQQVQLFENLMFKYINFPFGSSVLIVLKKSNA